MKTYSLEEMKDKHIGKQGTPKRVAYEKELRNAELEVREQLLSQISRELHDHVGHTLTYMHLLIENKKIDSPDLIL